MASALHLWVFCFRAEASVSVGVLPESLEGKPVSSRAHMAVTKLDFCGTVGARPLFFSDSAGGGPQSLATRLFQHG